MVAFAGKLPTDSRAMPFWLKKALTLPFMPLHFALLAGLAGLVLLFWTKRQKLGRALFAAAVVVLAVFSNRGVAGLLIASLETKYAAIPEAQSVAQLPPAAATCRTIVVLGGGHSDSPELSHLSQLSTSALGRLTEGVRLARLLPEARLIVSGYNGTKTFPHAQILAGAAQSLGVAPSRIVRFDNTRDTEEEAQAIAHEVGPEPFLLVTSAWHMPRSIALSEKAGLHPIPAPADFMHRSDPNQTFLAWDVGALERSTKALHEYLGLFWSRLRSRS